MRWPKVAAGILFAAAMAQAAPAAGGGTEAKAPPGDDQIIARGQQALASVLDPELPRKAFGAWLAKLVAPAKVRWEANDCGEQTGAPGGPDDFPVCAEAAATLADGRVLTVAVTVGTWKRGIVGKPQVFYAVMGQGGRYQQIKRLRDIAAMLPGSGKQ